MAAVRFMITALLLPTPSTSVTTKCAIPSVEAGSTATLITYFGEDMRNAKAKDFTAMHQRQNSTESEVLNCHFFNGEVKCDKTSCCTWESQVTDVFRVYIHNVSQEFEGRFWGLVSPADGDDQTFCRFALKGDTCSIEFINATNSYVNCSSMPVTIDHTCNVTCSSGYFIDGSQTWITYKCVGKNKWSPESRDISCNEHPKVQDNYISRLYFLFLLLSVIPVIAITIVLIKRWRRTKKEMIDAANTELLTKKERVKDYSNHDLMCNPNLKLRNVSYTDMRDDRNLLRLLNGLLAIADKGQKQNMKLVLSQLQVDKKCFGQSTSSADAALPKQANSQTEMSCQENHEKGEFDILIVHRCRQLLTLQISSVGEEFSHSEMTEEDVLIIDKVIKQLKMAEERLNNLTSEVDHKINITKCLVMPNIKSNQLYRAVDRNPAAGKDFCQFLGVKTVSDAMKMCLMSDQFSDKQTASDVNQTLKKWWQRIIIRAKSSSLNKQIVDRLCGSDTTIRLRDFEERSKRNGERMITLTLTPNLVEILKDEHKYAFICGPPGTGKSVLLALMALQRLDKGDTVYIFSTVSENIAASLALKHMLNKNKRPSKYNVHYKHFNLERSNANIHKIIEKIEEAAEKRSVFAIVDEIWANDRNQISSYFQCASKIFENPKVRIWGTCRLHDIIDSKFHKIELTVPLRYPRKVLEEVKKSLTLYTKERMHMYTTNILPDPHDDPDVITLYHREHVQKWPTDCVECGKAIAKALMGLGIGEVAGNLNMHDGDDTESTPHPLTYGDVFVLTQSTNLQSDDGIVTGLRESGINKLRVLKKDCSREELEDVVLARNNEVTVSYYLTIMGLQRKVVVLLPHRNKDDDKYSDNEIEAYGRNLGMSRCTSQLIVVDTALSYPSISD